MLIRSEKELEDYICNNQEWFKELLGNSLRIEPELINFIGRQVVVGSTNRLDLLYYHDSFKYSLYENRDPGYYVRYFIIVELKFRELSLDDLTQVARYMDAICSCTKKPEGVFENEPIAVLVGCGMSDSLRKVYGTGLLDNDKIVIVDIESTYTFSKIEQECGETNVKSIDKRLEEVLGEDPDGYMPLEDLDKFFEEMRKKREKNEHDRVSETPQET